MFLLADSGVDTAPLWPLHNMTYLSHTKKQLTDAGLKK